MFRKRIRSTCNRMAHLFPVRMEYGGSRWWQGRRVHVMYCPVCGSTKVYDYPTPNYYRQVA